MLPAALQLVLQLTVALVSPVPVGRLAVPGGDWRWRPRATAAAMVVDESFVQARREVAAEWPFA